MGILMGSNSMSKEIILKVTGPFTEVLTSRSPTDLEQLKLPEDFDHFAYFRKRLGNILGTNKRPYNSLQEKKLIERWTGTSLSSFQEEDLSLSLNSEPEASGKENSLSLGIPDEAGPALSMYQEKLRENEMASTEEPKQEEPE